MLVAQGQLKAVAKFDQVVVVEFLLAVGGHLALTGTAHAVTLFGVGQNHRGLAGVRRRRLVSGMDLHHVVATALQAVDLLIGHALRQARQIRVLAKEGVAVVAPVFGRKGLHLPVHRVGKSPGQSTGGVACEQAVPVAAPNELDHIPAGATEEFFQLVDDAAIAAHGSIQTLQIAVDHPHQVVQALTRRQGERAHGFGLVHLTIAKHAPHLALGTGEQLTVSQVTHEARVVDRADRANAHGAGGELPKIGHQVGMRIAGQAACALARAGVWRTNFLPVMQQIGFLQTTF